ncbi:MAG: hypothetical protein H7A46_03610 [Verrucomicrobiales bacterium]|nr:hypothetical protein [Verrucomicrobiales bacterium]
MDGFVRDGGVRDTAESVEWPGLVLPAEGDHFFSLAQQPGSSARFLWPGRTACDTQTDGDDYGEVVLAGDPQGQHQWSAGATSSVTAQFAMAGLQGLPRVNVCRRALPRDGVGDASSMGGDPLPCCMDDPDGDRVNLVEFAAGLPPGIANPLEEAFWLSHGSDVSESDVDVYYRESTLPCGLSIQVLHTASLQEPFAPRLAEGLSLWERARATRSSSFASATLMPLPGSSNFG